MSNAIASLEAAIAANPYDESGYKTLIPLIKVDTDRVTVYREAYSVNFNAGLSFWAEWLTDAPSSDLFEKALSSCPHFELANKYVEFASSLVEEDKLTPIEYRAILERLIIMCGSDVFTGSEIWKFYREFEVDEHEDLVDLGASAADIQKSKERFIKVYHRQLSLPLVGNEETLKEFEQKLGELCVASDAALINPAELEKKVMSAKETREGRLIYEMHLLSDKYEAASPAERETFWNGYIAFEKKQAQLSRTQRLYERAVLECPQSLTLWLEFTDFALSVLKNWPLLASVTKRALKVFRSSVFLWKLRLISLEGSHEAAEELQAAQQAALAAGLSNVEEYLEIYFTFCDYYRRQLEVTYQKLQTQKPVSAELLERAQAQVDGLHSALAQVQTFLTSYGANWVAGWWRACKYHAQTEATLLIPVQEMLAAQEAEQAGPMGVVAFGSKNSSQKAPKSKPLPGSDVWESALKLFPTSYFLYSEYIQWACRLKEFEHCRRVYRKMTNLHLDVGPSEVCKEWVHFEQQHGSLQDIQAALSRSFAHAQTELLQTHSAAAVAVAGVVTAVDDAMQVDAPTADANNRNKKRKAAEHSEMHCVAAQDNASAQQSTKKVKATSVSSDVIIPATPIPAATAARAAEATSAATPVASPVPIPVTTAPAAPTLSDNTVTVSNFPFHATMDSIGPMLRDKCTFSADDLTEAGVTIAGSVVNMYLLLSKAGHSRGAVEVEFAPVTAPSGETAPIAELKPFLQLVVNTLQGYIYNERALKAAIKTLPVPGAEKKEKVDPLVLQQRAGSVTAPHLTTVFVSHLAPEVTTAQLKEHFSACGEVLAAKVAVDKKTGESKRTGLVQFATESGRSAALHMNKTLFHNESIGVAPSRFSLITVAQAPTEASGGAVADAASVTKSTDGRKVDFKDAQHHKPQKKDELAAGTAMDITKKEPPSSAPSAAKPAPKFSNTSFKPRNLVKQAPKGKIQL